MQLASSISGATNLATLEAAQAGGVESVLKQYAHRAPLLTQDSLAALGGAHTRVLETSPLSTMPSLHDLSGSQSAGARPSPLYLTPPAVSIPLNTSGAHPSALPFPGASVATSALAGAGSPGANSTSLSLALLQAMASNAPASTVSPASLHSWGTSSSRQSSEPCLAYNAVASHKQEADIEAQQKTALLEYENEVLRQRLQSDSAEKMNLVHMLFNQIQQNGQVPPPGAMLPHGMPGMHGLGGHAALAAGMSPQVANKPKPAQSRYWTDAEHQRFLDAVQRFGAHDHKAIALVVGTRTSSQVRSHSQKFFKKLEQHKGDGIPNMNRKKKDKQVASRTREVDVEG